MNTFSWLLYFADVVGNLKVVFGLSMVAMIVSSVVLFVTGQAEKDFSNDVEARDSRWKSGRKTALIAFGLALLLAVMPSRLTIYGIAASEYGELVLNTPEARKLGDLIYQRLLEELQSATSTSDKR
jgi:hypothetical protein